MAGQKEPKPRWKRAVSMLDDALGELIGQLYVEKYFSPKAAYNIISAYKNGIGDLAIKQLRFRHRLIPFVYSGTYRNTLEGLALIEPMYYYHILLKLMRKLLCQNYQCHC